MRGLLERARELRSRLGLPERGSGEISFDAESGISREDQREILREIDRVAGENRITVTPEAFVLRAAKRGVLFPAVINLSLLVALGAGLGGLYALFQRGETSIAQGPVGTLTAEGKLIEELRKESEAQLEQKNREIDSIQGRLAALDRERQDLVATMDGRVKAREEELQSAMAAELEAERARLREQGLSEAEVTRRMADLEAQKTGEYTEQIDAFRAQAEADRLASEENLKALETEYRASLATASQERQQLLAESTRREEEIRAQMAATTASLETEKAQAESALASLAERQRTEDLASEQLVSLYAVARSAIAARDYDKAVQSLQAIRDYVSQAEVRELPAVARRRDTDLFVVETLTSYLQAEREEPTLDSATLAALANSIADLRAKVSEADRLARAGQAADAEKLYTQALEVLPEVSRSHAFFTEQTQAREAVRRETLRAGIARAEAAFTAGRSAEALALYRDALAYLPLESSEVDAVVSGISSAARGTSLLTRVETGKAGPELAVATQALGEGRYEEALSGFLDVLTKYPQSVEAPKAIEGISDSVKALNDRSAAALADREASWSRDLAGAQARLAEAAKGNTELQGKLEEANRAIALLEEEKARLATERDAQIEEWKNELAAADQAGQQAETARLAKALESEQARSAELARKLESARSEAKAAAEEAAQARGQAAAAKAGAARIGELEQALAAAKASEAKVREELAAAQEAARAKAPPEQQLAELPSAERALTQALAADYKAFTDRLAKLDPKTLDDNVVDQGRAVSYRNTFFSTPAMQQAFPRLASAIKRYDDWYFADGRKDVVRIVTELTSRPTRKERRSYYDQRLKFYQDRKDTGMVEFLKRLEPLVAAVE